MIAAHAPAVTNPQRAALLAAWQFFDQQAPPDPALSVAEFWAFAHAAWSPARLPPMTMLPAPARFEGEVSPRVTRIIIG